MTKMNVNTNFANYTNIKECNEILVEGKFETVAGKKSKFFYEILRKKTFIRT